MQSLRKYRPRKQRRNPYGVQRSWPLPGLGRSTFAVTARDQRVRARFAYGLQLTKAFGHTKAVRVFRAGPDRQTARAQP